MPEYSSSQRYLTGYLVRELFLARCNDDFGDFFIPAFDEVRELFLARFNDDFGDFFIPAFDDDDVGRENLGEENFLPRKVLVSFLIMGTFFEFAKFISSNVS